MIEDVLADLGASSRLTSFQRLACQEAREKLHVLAMEVNRMSSAEKHLRMFAERVAAMSGDETVTKLIGEASDLLEDMYR
jgi:C4-dicarboxylate-specific signal transduction histidine kinase